MKTTFAITLFFAAVLFAQNYRIVGPAAPKQHEATAIKDLTDYLAKRVKGDLTIGGKKNITFHVGDTQLAESKGLISTTLPDEKWVVKSFGDDVLINGGGQHGTLYATYHFLEDCCDIHWWSDFEDYVPPASPLTLPALDMSGRPAIRYRNIYRGSSNSLEITAIRNRLNANGAHVKATAAVGGSVDYGRPGWAHTFCMYLNDGKFNAAHPEYFALRDGKRDMTHRGQLCLAHPDLPAIIAEKMCAFIEKDRAEAAKNGVPYPIYYEVSMNDNGNACECEKCSEYAKKYNYSAQLIEFLNDISRRVAPKYPDIYISTLAYVYSDAPPKKDIKTEKNIVIRLCDTTTNQALSILHPSNVKFKEYVEAWKKHTDNLFIWDYAIAYHDEPAAFPFASEFYYGDLYKFYRDNNVTGIFWEHEYEYSADMFEYKFFLECKLMEDPDADIAKLQDIFMTRYYGAAAPFVMQYRRIIDRACHDNKGWIKCATTVPYTVFDFLTPPIMSDLDAVMSRAEDAVNGDAMLISRIRRARLGIDLLALKRCFHLNFYGSDYSKSENIPCPYDSAKVFRNLTVDWRKWTERYPDKSAYLDKIDMFVSVAEGKNGLKSFTPPEKFKDRSFIYFRPEQFKRFGNDVRRVKDGESCTGETVRIEGKKSHYYRLPFEMGCYDRDTKKVPVVSKINTVADKHGYNWYKLERVTVKERNDLYFNRAWTIQLPISYVETIGRTFDVWASLKFTGPMYHPDEKEGESFMYLDLVILEEVKP